MKTEITCILTKADKIKHEDRMKLTKAYADKLLRCGVITDEETRDWLCEYPLNISYNGQQSKVEFRMNHDHSIISMPKEMKHDEVCERVKVWRKQFFSVMWPTYKTYRCCQVGFIDKIHCDGEYKFGNHVITLTV